MESHGYFATVKWTGDLGQGTSGYKSYSRNHEIGVEGKPTLLASSDQAFRGDGERWNPEDMLLGSISACHMLWFLHLASEEGWVVRSYMDQAQGEMQINPDGSGQFVSAILRPEVVISLGDVSRSDALHHKAHEFCYIARSLSFEVECEGTVTVNAMN